MNPASIAGNSAAARGIVPSSAARARSFGRLCVVVCALLASAACSLALNREGEVAAYDFGTAAAAREGGPRLRRPLLVYEVSGPAWVDSALIH